MLRPPARSLSTAGGRVMVDSLCRWSGVPGFQRHTKSVGFESVFQLLGGVAGLPWKVTWDEEAICAPFMLHSTIAPLVLRNRMSEAPFPLKSPICAICQDEESDTGLPPNVTCCSLVI